MVHKQLKRSNAKWIKNDNNNLTTMPNGNTTIKSWCWIFTLCAVRQEVGKSKTLHAVGVWMCLTLYVWSLWWIGNQSSMLPCYRPSAWWEGLQKLLKTRSRNKCNNSPFVHFFTFFCNVDMCCKDVKKLRTWCACFPDNLHTAVYALKNKLQHHILSHCAIHIPSS